MLCNLYAQRDEPTNDATYMRFAHIGFIIIISAPLITVRMNV